MLKAMTVTCVVSALLAAGWSDNAMATSQTVDISGVRVTTNSNSKTIRLQKIGSSYVYEFDHANNQTRVYQNGQVVLSEHIDNAFLDRGGGVSYSASRLRIASASAAGIARPPEQISTMMQDPYPCMMSPCPVGSMPSPNPWYTPDWLPPDLQYYSPELPAWGSPPDGVDPRLAEFDYEGWESWRNEQCSVAHSAWTALGIASGVAVAFAACVGAVETGGLAIAACLGTAGGLAAAAGHTMEADDNCHADYPGYKQWP